MVVQATPGRRERDAARKRLERLQDRLVHIPKCADRARRERLEADPHAWLRFYFHDVFTYDFTEQQAAMIDALVRAMRHGGDQALAASRGEGKTTICQCVLAWAILSGVVRFAVLFSATGTDAEENLRTWKEDFLHDNDRLADDYPEVITPIRALENTPNRAHYQLVSGFRHDNGEPFEMASSKFSWCGRKCTMPKVPGSPAAGAILATRGLDSAVRGLKVGNQRPDVAVLDDPDTEETVNSDDQAAKLQKKIDKNIAGLAGQKRRLARVMLTTLQNHSCTSAIYTDPKQRHSWKGKRFRFLVHPPDRRDLWDEYIMLRSQGMEAFADGEGEDEHAREAHAFYLENRELMDKGAEVANQHRFDDSFLEQDMLPEAIKAKGTDGAMLQVEVSALQRYFNLVADLGEESVVTEYDNDPPVEAGPQESGISAYRIQSQVNGLDRRIIPNDCIKLTQGIDCRKVALHWVVRGWLRDGTGFTVDYDITDVHGTIRGTDEGVDLAVRKAILARIEEARDEPYLKQDGTPMDIDLTLVDAGWRTEAVYLATLEAGLGVMPAMGFGKSAGCAGPRFTDTQTQTSDRKSGDGWFMSRKKVVAKQLWLVGMDADRWKAWEHDRWMTDQGKAGAMTLWGEPAQPGASRLSFDQLTHFTFAKHLTAEVEVEEVNSKGVLVRSWKAKRKNNHWLDAAYMSNVAANVCGIKLLKAIEQQQQRKQQAPAQQSAQRPAPPQNTSRGRPIGRPGGASGRQRGW